MNATNEPAFTFVISDVFPTPSRDLFASPAVKPVRNFRERPNTLSASN